MAAGRLRGRRILITGAASGIGRRTAELFAAEGAALALLDRNAEGLAEAARAMRGAAVEADVTQEASVAQAVAQAATAIGGIDGVVNAAGIVLHGSVLDVDVSAWRRVIEVNLTGTYIVVRCCLPWLRQAPLATIVNIASGQGLLPNVPNMTAYAASKGGVVNLTRALAAELAPAIRVNSVCPGMVDTPMTAMRAPMRCGASPTRWRSRRPSCFSAAPIHPSSPAPRSPSTAAAPSTERRHCDVDPTRKP
jgi:NAD(P)-dependent dehydrogenase (short-subunit alcohol dehydrogenase family)